MANKKITFQVGFEVDKTDLKNIQNSIGSMKISADPKNVLKQSVENLKYAQTELKKLNNQEATPKNLEKFKNITQLIGKSLETLGKNNVSGLENVRSQFNNLNSSITDLSSKESKISNFFKNIGSQFSKLRTTTNVVESTDLQLKKMEEESAQLKEQIRLSEELTDLNIKKFTEQIGSQPTSKSTGIDSRVVEGTSPLTEENKKLEQSYQTLDLSVKQTTSSIGDQVKKVENSIVEISNLRKQTSELFESGLFKAKGGAEQKIFGNLNDIENAIVSIQAISSKGITSEYDLQRIKELQGRISATFEVLVESAGRLDLVPSEAQKNAEKDLKKLEKDFKDTAENIESSFQGAAAGFKFTTNFKDASKDLTALRSQISTLKSESGKAAELSRIAATSDIQSQAARGVTKKEWGTEAARDAEIARRAQALALKKYNEELGELETREKNVSSIYNNSKNSLQNLKNQYDQNVITLTQLIEKEKQSGNPEAQARLDKLKQSYEELSQLIGTKITQALEKSELALKKQSASAKVNSEALDVVKSKVKELVSIYFLFNQVGKVINNAVQEVKALDKELTQIAIVTKQTNEEMWDTFNTFNKAAAQLSTTTRQYLEGAKIFYQQGMNTAEVMEMVEATTKAAALSGIDFREASETLTAAINGYNMEATQAMNVTDKFAAVGAASAADFAELSTAMEKVASQAYSSGMSFDSLLGILAKGIETTREAPEAIGTGLKTIIARFQEMKENPMADLEDGVNANRVEKALKTVGVALRDSNGEFRNMDDVFADLGESWKTMSRNQRAYIATMAAGSRQQSRFMAIMNDYDRTLQLVKTSTNSAGEANAQYAIYTDSLEAAQNRYKNSLEAFNVALASSDLIRGYYEAMQGILDVATAAGPIMTGLSVALTVLTIKHIAASVAASKEAMALALVNKEENAQLLGIPKLIKWITSKIFARQLETAAVVGLASAEARAAQAALYLNATTGGLLIAIGAVVSLIIWGIGHFQSSSKTLAENTQKLIENANQSKQMASNYENLVERYDELSKKINLTNAEQEELLSISNEIAKLSPNLVNGIDEEGNARLANIDSLREELRLKKEVALQDAKNAAAKRAEASKKFGFEDEAGMTESQKANFQKIKDLETEIEKIPELQIYDEYGGQFVSPIIYQVAEELKTGQIELEDARSKIYESLSLDENNPEHKKAIENVNSYLLSIENFYTGRLADTKTQIALASRDLINLQLDLDPNKSEYSTSIINSFGNLQNYVLEELEREASEAAKKQGVVLTDEFLADFIEQNYERVSEEAYKALSSAQDKMSESAENQMKMLGESVSAGLSQAEIDSQITSIKTSLEGVDDELKDLIISTQFDQKAYDDRAEKIGNLLFPDQEDSIKLAKDSMSDYSSSFNSFLADLADTGDENLNNAVKEIYTGGATSEQIKDINESYSKLDKTSMSQIEKFKQKLMDTYGEGILTDEVLDNMFVIEGDPFGAIAEKAKGLVDQLKKLQDISKEPMGFAEGMQAIADYGIENVIALGDQFLLDSSYIEAETERIKFEQAELLADQIELLKNQIEETKKLRGEDDSRVKILELQKEQYEKMRDSLLDIEEIEGRRKNIQVLENLRIISETEKKLKDYAEAMEKVSLGEMGTSELLDLVEQYPELIKYLEQVNGITTITKENFLIAAEVAKQSAIEQMEADNEKLRLQIANLEAMQIEQTFSKKHFEEVSNAMDLQKAESAYQTAQTEYETRRQLHLTNIALADNAKQWYNNLKARGNEVTSKELLYAQEAMVDSEENVKKSLLSLGDAQTSLIKSKQDLDLAREKALYTDAGIDPSTIKSAEDLEGVIATLTEALNRGDLSLEDYKKRTLDLNSYLDSLKSGSDSASDSIEELNDSLEKHYNLLRKIEDLESDLDMLQSRIDLESTSAKDDLNYLKQKADKINQLIGLQKDLILARKAELLQMQAEKQSLYGTWVQVVNGNAVILNQIALSKALMSGAMTQEFYDGLKEYIEGYNDLSNSIRDTESAILDLQKQQEEMYDEIINKAIDTRQQLYDALVEADERELEEIQEKFDKMTEMENEYLSAVKNAIEQERKAREDAQKEEDIITKKRRLATLQRDTSGLYATEAAKLQKEIADQEMEQRDAQVDSQLEALENQIKVQQEQRDLQMQMIEEQQRAREETGYYWDRVDDAIQNGPKAMVDLLTSTQEYQTADPLAQSQQLDEFKYSTKYLSELVGGAGNGKIISAIEQAAKDIVNNNFSEDGYNLDDGNEEKPTEEKKTEETKYYTVKSGDTLSKIANKLGVPYSTIQAKNQWIKNRKGWDWIYPGDRIAYKEGGIVDYTGPAWVDGTTGDPEAFLNAKQTEIFAQMRDDLEQSRSFALKTGQAGSSASTSIGDIIINLQNPINASAEAVAALVKKDILNSIQNRVSMTIQNVR